MAQSRNHASAPSARRPADQQRCLQPPATDSGGVDHTCIDAHACGLQVGSRGSRRSRRALPAPTVRRELASPRPHAQCHRVELSARSSLKQCRQLRLPACLPRAGSVGMKMMHDIIASMARSRAVSARGHGPGRTYTCSTPRAITNFRIQGSRGGSDRGGSPRRRARRAVARSRARTDTRAA